MIEEDIEVENELNDYAIPEGARIQAYVPHSDFTKVH